MTMTTTTAKITPAKNHRDMMISSEKTAVSMFDCLDRQELNLRRLTWRTWKFNFKSLARELKKPTFDGKRTLDSKLELHAFDG